MTGGRKTKPDEIQIGHEYENDIVKRHARLSSKPLSAAAGHAHGHGLHGMMEIIKARVEKAIKRSDEGCF